MADIPATTASTAQVESFFAGTGLATFSGTLEAAGDQDYIKVYLSSAVVFNFSAVMQSDAATGNDITISLRDSSGNLVPGGDLFDDGGVELDSFGSFQVAVSDFYYIDVHAFFGEFGAYSLAITNAGNVVVLGTTGNDNVLVGAVNEEHILGAGDDRFQGNAAIIHGQQGNDELIGGSGSQTITGGLGDEIIFGLAGGDVIHGDAGNDTIDGGADNDYIMGGDGDDMIEGGLGQDRMNGGTGHNALYGGAGDDVYEIVGSNDAIVELAGEGSDTIFATVSLTLGATSEIEAISVSGLATVTIVASNTAQTITDSASSNTLRGMGGDDVISGQGGGDTIDGGLGNDFLYGDGGTDNIVGGAGRDRVFGGLDADTLSGGLDNDYISGGDGADRLLGNEGDDVLVGGAGIDRLEGGTGANSLSGGTENDVYIVTVGTDRITELFNSGTDTVYATVSYALGALNANVEFMRAYPSTATTALNLTGNALGQALYGNNGINVLAGLGGNDVLSGGNGNDVLSGGADIDTLQGGAGLDRFDFNAITESGTVIGTRDIVVDFIKGQDRIDVSTIDAIVGGTNDAFVFDVAKGTAATAVATGHIGWYQEDPAGTVDDYTVLRINNDADADIDMTIAIKGLITLAATDFVL